MGAENVVLFRNSVVAPLPVFTSNRPVSQPNWELGGQEGPPQAAALV
jgi:hypothetical protein